MKELVIDGKVLGITSHILGTIGDDETIRITVWDLQHISQEHNNMVCKFYATQFGKYTKPIKGEPLIPAWLSAPDTLPLLEYAVRDMLKAYID